MCIAKTIGGSILSVPLLLAAFQAHAVVLWSFYDPITINENGSGTDLLGGALKRNGGANDTLYFKLRVEPISDESTEPYFAALELFEDDTARLGVGNALELGDAQLAVTNAGVQMLQAEFQLGTARAQLLKALGV